MHVRNGFSCIFAVVYDDAEAFFQSALGGDFGGDKQKVPHDGFILSCCFGYAGNWLSGDNENVGGSLRVDVANGEAGFVLIFEFTRDFSLFNFLENGEIGHD